MDEETWVALFTVALVELRPHLTARMAMVVAHETYTIEDKDPKTAARAYHAKQKPQTLH